MFFITFSIIFNFLLKFKDYTTFSRMNGIFIYNFNLPISCNNVPKVVHAWHVELIDRSNTANCVGWYLGSDSILSLLVSLSIIRWIIILPWRHVGNSKGGGSVGDIFRSVQWSIKVGIIRGQVAVKFYYQLQSPTGSLEDLWVLFIFFPFNTLGNRFRIKKKGERTLKKNTALEIHYRPRGNQEKVIISRSECGDKFFSRGGTRLLTDNI